ncbi:MAG: 30S ribosomal protein S3 [Thermoplasmata archaeon]
MTSERKFIEENVNRLLVKEYLMRVVKRSGFGGVEIQRTPLGTRIALGVEKPGLVIGKKGATIRNLTTVIEEKFKIRNPQIEVQELQNPALSSQIMAQRLAEALERGWHFRRAAHSTVKRIMDAGAKGCLVRVKGKLTGERHRTEKFKEGHIKFCGETALQWVSKGYAQALTKPGVIGIVVYIMDPNTRLPDEIEIKSPIKEAEVKPETEIKTEVETKEEPPKEQITETPKDGVKEDVKKEEAKAEKPKEKEEKQEEKKPAKKTRKKKVSEENPKEKKEGESS